MKIERQDKIKTEFGTAKIMNTGYYRITSKKEGNVNKLLHRLIFEDCYSKLYGCNYKIPKGFIVHHKDDDKLNNNIFNLELMSDKDHTSLHHKGVKMSEESRAKMSKAKSGKNHPMYGKHLSEEQKAKRRNATGGKNNAMFGKTGENHPKYKKEARIIKQGITSAGNRRYALVDKGNVIRTSIFKDKLEEELKRMKGDNYE